MVTERFQQLLKRKADEAGKLGVIETSLEDVVLVKLTEPVAKTGAMLMPGLCLVAQGRKHIYLGDQRYTYDQEHFVLGGCKLPVYAELETASEKKPYYGMAVFLNSKIVSELMLQMDGVDAKATLQRPEGLIVSAKLTDNIQDAVCRLLQVLGDETDEMMMGPSLLREIYYWTLRSEAGPYLKNAAFQHAKAHRVAPLIHYLEKNLQNNVTIADLAKFAGMSASALHGVFKEATTLSPMQYLKRLRLNQAHQLLMTGATVNEAADGSGYGSRTQFSREFSRLFGFPPKDVVALG